MLIQSIKQDQKKSKNAIVELDDGNKYKVYKFVVKKFGLRKGDQINTTKIKEILYWDEFYRAKDRALKYLSYRRRSENEIKIKLQGLQFQTKIIEDVLANLKNVGIVDDYEFAESYAQEIFNKRVIGKSLLKQRLMEKKIPREIILKIIEKYYQNVNERDIAYNLAIKQLKKYRVNKSKDDDKKNYLRLTSFLARRGFSWEVVSCVMKDIFKKKFNNREE